jgi:probable HAF family extracellular repeat protein
VKSRTLTIVMGLFAALAIPAGLAAQPDQQHNKQLPHYTVTDLGPAIDLGGGVNNKDWVDGTALLPDGSARAFLWRKGNRTLLGTSGGPNSAVFRPASERGQVVGEAETATPDRLGEDFCGFGTQLVCLPFLWQNGVKTPLPTLGGNNGSAFSVNNRGQVVGGAENTTLDATCPSPTLEVKPVIWENGGIQELPTLPGDPDGTPGAINDHGQAAGTSGSCFALEGSVGVFHNALWQNGTVIDLGNLGSTLANEPDDINNRGQVVGFSSVPCTSVGLCLHAWLWTEATGIQDLGTLPSPLNVFSGAHGINDKGQVVGFSCDDAFFDCSAFLWENGVMTDLNTLVPGGGSAFTLAEAFFINSDGSIETFGVTSADEPHAFLLTPMNDEAASEGMALSSQGEATERPRVPLPENVRKMLRLRLGHRYHIPGLSVPKD